MKLPRRIVSGGQTGADQGALDAGMALGVPVGGWVPAGRLDEAGVIPAEYPGLVECDSADPAVRTRLNVRDSDATLIVSHGPLSGGSLATQRFATELGRPCLHLDLSAADRGTSVRTVLEWVHRNGPAVLNVAGPRASKDPEIRGAVFVLLTSVWEGDPRERGVAEDGAHRAPD